MPSKSVGVGETVGKKVGHQVDLQVCFCLWHINYVPTIHSEIVCHKTTEGSGQKGLKGYKPTPVC
jgi:hypothetical protein